MTKYEKFAKEYALSGLTQKAYAEKIGKSTSVVSYYLKRSREQKSKQFTAVQIQSGSDNNYIRIVTNSGVEVEIPI